MAEMEEKGGLSTTECKVAPFYKGSNIFITGGSGFLGIALIEKLLRTLDVGTIYVLLRQKKGVNIEDRLVELCNNKVFTTIKESIGSECFKKLHPIGGDVEKPNLGISDSDQRLLENNVNIVFHLAACLDFGGNLRTNVTINLLGTRQVVQLCKGMSNLKALIHVSSAYVNSNLKEAAEVIYPSSVDVESLIKMVETKTDAELEKEEKKILRDYPNAYTLTKFLAEHEVANGEKLKKLSAIVRPSMITSAWKEPVPGWTVSKNGPTGFFMGASKGVVRRLPVSKNTIYDYVPVDVVVNTILVAACYVASKSPNEVSVFHCTSSTSNPFRWADVENHINGLLLRYPLCSAIWYPHLKLVSNMTHFRISTLFVHFLPAYILDTIIKLAGGRPRLVRLHTSIGKSLVLLEPFIFHEWKFHNDHSIMLHKCLSANEQEKFGIDFTTLNWLNYFDDVTQGVRRYLHNEEPKTLGAARRKNFVLLILHIFLMAVIFGGIWYAGTHFYGMTPISLIVPVITYMMFNIL